MVGHARGTRRHHAGHAVTNVSYMGDSTTHGTEMPHSAACQEGLLQVGFQSSVKNPNNYGQAVIIITISSHHYDQAVLKPGEQDIALWCSKVAYGSLRQILAAKGQDNSCGFGEI